MFQELQPPSLTSQISGEWNCLQISSCPDVFNFCWQDDWPCVRFRNLELKLSGISIEDKHRTLALRPNPASIQPCIYPELGACHLLCRWWVSRALLPKEEAGSSSAPLKGTKVRWRHAFFHITYYTAAGVSSGVTGVMLAETEEPGWKNIHWTALKLLIWFVEVGLFSDVPVNRYACSDMGNYLDFCCISQKT